MLIETWTPQRCVLVKIFQSKTSSKKRSRWRSKDWSLIGKRRWGGVVGITNRGNLIDGGTVNVPEFALANTKGQYVIEGYGVDPDIEVDNDPKSVISGHDPQLERAVQEVMKKLTQPVKLPGRPADPVKNRMN